VAAALLVPALRLADGKIGQVLFCVASGRMVLLHGFVKKT
jgi:hypothetical protein